MKPENIDTSIPEGETYRRTVQAHEAACDARHALSAAREAVKKAAKVAADDRTFKSLLEAADTLDRARDQIQRSAAQAAITRRDTRATYEVPLNAKLDAGAEQFERVRQWILEDK